MSEQITVSFPGFGIEPFSLNKIAFILFDRIEVRWYGIFITFGIILAFLYAAWRAKRNEGIILDDVLDIGISTVICGIVGARAYYVLTTLDTGAYKSFYDVVAIWEGGLAIYGGVIGGCLGILLACSIKKLSWKKAFDMIAPGVILAQAIGRWGNFFNGEAYGSAIGETTQYFFFLKEFQLPAGEGTVFNLFRMGLYPNDINPFLMVYVHPTFLYECLWSLLGFLVLNLFYKHKKYDGEVALLYFSWYGFGRMFIEGLRTDSLYIFKGLVSAEGLRISQCVGLLCFIFGVGFLISHLFCRPLSAFMTVKETAPVPVEPESSAEAERRDEEQVNGILEDIINSNIEKLRAEDDANGDADTDPDADKEEIPEGPSKETSDETPEELPEETKTKETTPDGNEN